MMMIRSQDKFKLFPMNRPISIFDENVFYCDEDLNGGGYLLGTYSSTDRCLEILDEIQREFQYNNHFSGSGVNCNSCQNWNYGVYEMPEK